MYLVDEYVVVVDDFIVGWGGVIIGCWDVGLLLWFFVVVGIGVVGFVVVVVVVVIE